MGHRNICCDGCQRANFPGRRYKCLRCDNYDLCGECYDNGIITCRHLREHPMQLILDFRHRELYFSGENFDEMHLPNCYTCPYCGSTGHTAKRFIEHVMLEHRHTEGYVICPMCVSMPNVNIVQMRSLWRHLQRMHMHHANLLDPNGPPFRRRLSRRSRRRFGAAAAISSFLSGESEPAIDMLIELAETRQSRSEAPTRAPSERRVTLEGLDLFEEHRLTPAILGPYSSISAEGRTATATECPSAGSIKGAIKNDETNSSSCELSENQSYLLPPLLSHMKKDENSTNLQLVKRAHFVEQLLISTIAQDELKLPCELNEEDLQECSNHKQELEEQNRMKQNASEESSKASLCFSNLKEQQDEDKEKVIVESASEDSSHITDCKLMKKSIEKGK